MEAETFQNADRLSTDSWNGNAVGSGDRDPKVAFTLTHSHAGKAARTVPKGARPLIPCPIYDLYSDWICAISFQRQPAGAWCRRVSQDCLRKGLASFGYLRILARMWRGAIAGICFRAKENRLTIGAGKQYSMLNR